MFEDNPIRIETDVGDRRLYYTLPSFFTESVSPSLMAVAVLLEMLADRAEAYVIEMLSWEGVGIDETIVAPTESTYGLDADLFFPTPFRDLAEAIRDRREAAILFARRAVVSYTAFDELPSAHLNWLNLSYPLNMLVSTLWRRGLADAGAGQLANTWMALMQRLLLWGAVNRFSDVSLSDPTLIHWEPGPHPSYIIDTYQSVSADALLPIADQIANDWWIRFQESMPWRKAMESELL